MVSFYPGPSRVYDDIPKYVANAARLGIMSMNHRSDEFVAISKKTIELLKLKLGVPKDYTIFFTSSATECWEIIAQSWVKESIHIFSGAFGEKWYEYTKRLKPTAKAIPFDRETKLKPAELIFTQNEIVICITHNETSNGTQVSNSIIKKIKNNNTQHLIAVDATSSMAGVELNFKDADIWFASVQKCFGLPAGLAIMVCSPQAIERAHKIQENNHYNSVVFMNAMMDKWQTPYTPNVLGIYLLMRVLEKMKPIKEVHQLLTKRHANWISFLTKHNLQPLIKNEVVRSLTVLPIAGEPEQVKKIKAIAKKKGFLLGEGYGALKETTFRIANFPALKNAEINSLMTLLKSILK
jgi:phosphoserine aminotransferase